MKALFISKDGEQFMLADIPERHRNGFYEMAAKQRWALPSVANWHKFKPIKIRTFAWRGKIVNKDNTKTLIDFFEEVTS